MATKKRITDEQLLEYLLNQQGGRDKVLGELHNYRISEMAAEGKTLLEIWGEAEADGWDEYLGGLTLADLMGVLSTNPKPKSKRAYSRESPEGVKTLQNDILLFIGANPWTTRNAIATDLGISKPKASYHLKKLRGDGVIKMHGKNTKSVYALANEKKRPPKK